MAEKEERKRVGEAYIVEFYNDILALTRFYANYLTFGLEIESKYGGKELQLATDDERANLRNILQNLRYHILKSYIQYEAIVENLGDSPDAELGNLYTKCNNNYSIKRDELQDYVKRINKVLLQNVKLKSLLDSALASVSEMYGDQPAEQ